MNKSMDKEPSTLETTKDAPTVFHSPNALKFRCIVADPPWHYGRSWGTGSVKSRVKKPKAAPMPYEQMSLQQIKSLPVAGLASENCELYLWVTQKYLPDAFEVLKAWSFKYCQTLTWCKAPMGTGQGGLYCPTTEFMILGRRGKMPQKRRMDSTWWKVKRQKRHSQKPEWFQDMIEAQSDGPRLELFARRKRLGWSAWGNEVPCDVNLDTPNPRA